MQSVSPAQIPSIMVIKKLETSKQQVSSKIVLCVELQTSTIFVWTLARFRLGGCSSGSFRTDWHAWVASFK
jgi:hypothetical protein